jgi:SAM-dependent methyltransferase
MPAHGDQYVLDAGKSGHARLRAISEIHDDRTRALLLGAGLGAGDRYVEFGCGLGYVTRWATSVGAEALGIDLSADQIAEATSLAEGTTEFRVGSVYDHGPASGKLRRVLFALAAHAPEPAMTESRYDEISEAMRAADDDPSTLVAHARMHQLVARKPLSPL